MRRIFLALILLSLATPIFAQTMEAQTAPAGGERIVLQEFRMGQGLDNIRLVFDMSAPFTYTEAISDTEIALTLPNTKMEDYTETIFTKNQLADRIVVHQYTNDLELSISLTKQGMCDKIFKLKDPNRLVIDIKRREPPILLPPTATPAKKSTIQYLEYIVPGSSAERLRVVLTLSKPVRYEITSNEAEVMVTLEKCKSRLLKDEIKLLDPIMEKVYLTTEKEEDSITVHFALNYWVPYKMMRLNHPTRLVFDFDRIFKQESKTSIAEGLEYRTLYEGTARGPLNVNMLFIDPGKFELLPALAKPDEKKVKLSDDPSAEAQTISRWGKDKVSEFVADNGATAGINGGYFSWTGMPLGILLINKELVASPLNGRTALLIDEDRKLTMDHPNVEAKVSFDGQEINVDKFNSPIESNEVVVFTRRYGSNTESGILGVDIVADDGKIKQITPGNADIPEKGYVLSAHGIVADALRDKAKEGMRAEMSVKLSPPGNWRHIIGGGPRLIKDRQVNVTADAEQFKKDIKNGRAARTAVGVTDRGKILLVVADGRNRNGNHDKSVKVLLDSIGMTLEELAAFMALQGCNDAMNLDGGSSTTMVVGGIVVNNPVKGEESKVSNAILVKRK